MKPAILVSGCELQNDSTAHWQYVPVSLHCSSPHFFFVFEDEKRADQLYGSWVNLLSSFALCIMRL